jgi:hypothetical protein
MPGYSAPTSEDVRKRAGVNRDALTMTEAQFDERIAELLPDAENGTRLAVGRAIMDSTSLADEQAAGLRIAVAYRAGVAYLIEVAGRRASGTNAPLDQESSEEIRGQAEFLLGLAKTYEAGVLAAVSGGQPEEANPSRTGFTDPVTCDEQPAFRAGRTPW